ncbi:transcriptional regulator [Cytophagales bacterium WSM2-2]|nr:transcriptional regulator [Cytophagales bacterium WSM2-2]
MEYIYQHKLSQSRLRLQKVEKAYRYDGRESSYFIIWNKGAEVSMLVDGIPFRLKKNTIITLTPVHKFHLEAPHTAVYLFEFNDGFYCVERHDHEVGCVGYLFYGSQHIPQIKLAKAEELKFDLLLSMFEEEFSTHDNIQGEMLTSLLKRLIITCTRLAKQQQSISNMEPIKFDLIRKYNSLVEIHFRNRHDVSFYASELNKSPKTLSNLFALHKFPTPLDIIHRRIVTEARRYLLFSEQSVKEIAHALGFDEASNFAGFFKSQTGHSPSNFRDRHNQKGVGKY